MSTNVTPPFQSFLDAYGKPLQDGKIYIGEAGQNAETTPVAVFWDEAGTIPAAQPIRTSGGYPVRSGSPANIYVASSYSIIVKDKNDVLVFTAPVNQVAEGISAVFYGWKNYVAESSFENGTTTGWNLGKDTGTTVPLSGGIGGGASSFLPLTIDKTNPLAGANSLSLNKPASNCQGSTLYSNNMTIDLEDTNSGMQLELSYMTPATDYTTDDYKVFLWDVTAGALITLSTNSLPDTIGLPGKFSASFTSSNNRVYRIVIMCVTAANLDAISVTFDSIIFRPAVTVSNALTLGGTSLLGLQKWTVERRHEVGEIFPLLDYKVSEPWNGANPDTYFPAYCLSVPDPGTANDTKTFTAAKAPNAVTYLRAIKSTYKRGLSGEVSSFSVTGSAISGNVVTLTFANTADVLAILASIAEEQSVHGSYTNWMSVTLGTAIGAVPAGDYAITNINAISRTLTFAYTSANNATNGAGAAQFYPFRVPGAATSARIFAMQGRTLVSANDSAQEVVAGLRRRDRLQGHKHSIEVNINSTSWGTIRPANSSTGTQATEAQAINPVPTSDGTNGIPRTGTTTDPRALGVHYFLHLGELLA